AGPYTEGDKEYMDVYKKVIHVESFAAAPADELLMQVMAKVLDGPVLLHNRKIGRINFPKNVQQTTAAHQDFHYIRGTPETYTMWMPVGDCPVHMGGLAVLKSSHRQGYLEHGFFNVKKYAGHGLGEEQWPRDEDIQWHAGDFLLGD